MKYIGWIGCLGFALVGLYQHNVINSLEHNIVVTAKFHEPIRLKEGNKIIRLRTTD